MLVLKTTSPAASPSAPNAVPSKLRPSANARIAFMDSLGCRERSRTRWPKSFFARVDNRIHHRLVALLLIDLAERHAHPILFRTGHVLANVIGPHWDFAMAPVDQDGEPHRSRPARAKNNAQRAFDRAPREDNIVDQNDFS